MTFYNPSNLVQHAAEVLDLWRAQRADEAQAKLREVQAIIYEHVNSSVRLADILVAQGQPMAAIGHRTVVLMVLRSFPMVPDAAALMQDNYLALAAIYRAVAQPLAAVWADRLARTSAPFFPVSASCQLPVLPALLEHYLGRHTAGRFVEIGAYDGVTFSNTSGLVDLGWSGIYVEPHPPFYWLCQQRYGANPRVRLVPAAIGALAGEGSMVTRDGFHVLSLATGSDAPRVPIKTLDAVLEETAVVPGFELLGIDVEGHEEQVFLGFDIARWRPRLMLIELPGFDPANQKDGDLFADLHRRIIGDGYKLAYWDSINTVYVAD